MSIAPAPSTTSSPASPSSGLAAIPAAIASLVPAALVPAALAADKTGDDGADAGEQSIETPPALDRSSSLTSEAVAATPVESESAAPAAISSAPTGTHGDASAISSDQTDEVSKETPASPSTTIAGLASAAAAAVVAAGGAVAAGATEIFSGAEPDERADTPSSPTTPHTATEASVPASEAEIGVPGSIAGAAEADDDSSDDEVDGPEDLDGQPSYIQQRAVDEAPFGSSTAGTDGVAGGESLSRQASSHLASTASAFGSFESTAAPAAAETDPFASDEPLDAFVPAPIAAGVPLPLSPAGSEPPHAIASAFPPVAAGGLDDPFGQTGTTTAVAVDDDDDGFNTFDSDFVPVPVAPGTGTSVSNNNPFFSAGGGQASTTIAESSAVEGETPKAINDTSSPSSPFDAPRPPSAALALPPAPPAPPAASSMPAPPPIPARREPVSQPSPAPHAAAAAAFDDSFGNDDFDTFDTEFEPVPVARSAVTSPVPATNNPFSAAAGKDTSTLAAAAPVYDFDPSFADFDTAFDDARPSKTQAPAAAVAVQLAPPIGNDAFSVDDAFGSSPFAPGAVDHAHASSAGQHAFDDAFTDAPPAPQQQQQQQYAAPVGPPPGHIQQQQQQQRPSLPSRPTENAGAEPDDIPDVKKIVAMGFSRSQALNALEVRFPHPPTPSGRLTRAAEADAGNLCPLPDR